MPSQKITRKDLKILTKETFNPKKHPITPTSQVNIKKDVSNREIPSFKADKNTAGNRPKMPSGHKKTLSMGSNEFLSGLRLNGSSNYNEKLVSAIHSRKTSKFDQKNTPKVTSYAQLELERRQIVSQFRASPARRSPLSKLSQTSSAGLRGFGFENNLQTKPT